MLSIKYIILIVFSVFLLKTLKAQESLSKNCNSFLNEGFVSDGQEYKADLDENNRAFFYTTFYGGSNYRIVGCSKIKKYPLIISVYDIEKNLLFCNKDYHYSPYWNFTFTSTIDCIIEFEFKTEAQLKDEVMLLIGFKEK